MADSVDPSILLPRDGTGRYLHLKLKRFASIEDLSMPYAIKTWKQTPQDAEVDMAPSARSKCRDCQEPIDKGDLRFRLWLQCHKGCKNSAYFHSDCFYRYPETRKLESVQDIKGYQDMDEGIQKSIRASFGAMKKETDENIKSSQIDGEAAKEPTKKKRKVKKSS